MKKILQWGGLVFGAFVFSVILAVYGQTAVQTIAGLAVAQTGTLWNNVKDAAFGDNATNGILASQVYVFDGTNFDRVRGDTSNGLDVDVTRVSGTVTIAGATTPSDNFANPTTALNTFSLIAGFDGTTWDRILSQANSADALATSALGMLAVNSFPRGWNGTTFDRIRSTSNAADAVATTTTGNQNSLSFGLAWNGTTFDRVRSSSNAADAVATTTTGNQNVLAFLAGWNGTTFDRVRAGSTAADAIATTTTGNVGVLAYTLGWNGTTFDRVRALANNADDVAVSTTGNLSVQSFTHEFDGTTYDRVRNQFVQSTAGVTTNAAGTTVTMTTTPMANYTMIIDRTAGSTNVVEVDLQCSINNTAFVQIATIISLANEPILVSIAGVPCDYMRYNVVTIGAGNTIAIDLLATR